MIIKQHVRSLITFAAFVAFVVGIAFTVIGFAFAATLNRRMGDSYLLTALCFGALAGAIGFVASLLLMSRDVISARKRILSVAAQLSDRKKMSFDEFRLHFVGIRDERLRRMRNAIAGFYNVDPERIHPSLDLPDVLVDLRSPALPIIVAQATLPKVGRIRLEPMGQSIDNLAEFIVGVNRVIQQATA